MFRARHAARLTTALFILAVVLVLAVPHANAQLRFIRGDLTGDGGLDINDLQALVGGPPFDCDDAADCDDDGIAGTLADLNYLTDFLFGPGPAPPAPYPDCDVDPTPDAIGCMQHGCGQYLFLRGDLSGNGLLGPLDLAELVGGPPFRCDDCADIDDDGLSGTAADITYLQNHLTAGGPPPPPPFPECGADVTVDLLSCGFHDCDLCDCGLWGDINGDFGINPLDVAFLVNFVFRGLDARVPPPNCYAEVGDVDCSGGLPTPPDVALLVAKVYAGFDGICPNPCTIHGF